MIIKRILCCILGLLALWSCSSDVQDLEGTKDYKTFEIDRVSVQSVNESGMNSIDMLKVGKVFNFSTCIHDATFNQAVTFKFFDIEGGEEAIRVRSDENGCIYWSEAVDIDDLVKMGFQKIYRTITGLAPYQGTERIPFGFQPLENGANAMVDLRYSEIPDSYQSKLLRNSTPEFAIGTIQVIPVISVQTQEQLMTPYREVAVQVRVRLLEGLSGKGITKHRFKVALTDNPDSVDWASVPTLEYAVNTSGVYVTSTIITFKRFAGEQFMEKYVVAKSMEAPFDETPVYRAVYINPWQWWEKFFLWDSEWDDPSEVPEYQTEPIEDPSLLIQEIWLSYTGNVEDSYRLDKHLNFTFTKNYQIKFRPFLNRKKTYVPNDDLIFEKLQIARLKAKLVLIRPKNGEVDLVELERRGIEGLSDYEYVTGTEVIVPVRFGLALANFSLDFKFTDIPFMVTRSLLLAEISPADPDWEVEPALVTITMKAGEFWVTEGALFATKIIPGGYNAEDVLARISQGEKMETQELHQMPQEFTPRKSSSEGLIDPLTSYQEHQIANNPHMLVFNEQMRYVYPFFEKLRVEHSLFRNLYNYANNTISEENYQSIDYFYENEIQKSSYQALNEQLCQHFYSSQGACARSKDPAKYFHITPLTFVVEEPLFRTQDPESGEITNHVMKISTGRDKFGVSLNLKKTRGNGSSNSVSTSISLKLSSIAKIVPWLGTIVEKLGLDFGYTYSNSRTTSDVESTDMGVASNYNLVSDHLQLGFWAKTHSCLLIEKRPDKIKEKDEDYKKLTYMVCRDSDNELQFFREDWYFVNPANTDLSHFVDYNGITNRNMIYPIRGIHNFVAFRDLITTHLDYFLSTNQEQYQPLVRLALQQLFNIHSDGIPAFNDGHYPGLVIGNQLLE